MYKTFIVGESLTFYVRSYTKSLTFADANNTHPKV